MFKIHNHENIKKNSSLNWKNMIIQISQIPENNTIVPNVIDKIVNLINEMPSNNNSKECLTIVLTNNQSIMFFNFFKSTSIIKRKRYLLKHFSSNGSDYKFDHIYTGST